MIPWTNIPQIVKSVLWQMSKHGVAYTLRQNYQKRVSPRYRRLTRKEAPQWLAAQKFPTTGGLSVHMLICASDLVMGLCAAASFVIHYGRDIDLFFHDDGSLGPDHAARIRAVFPNARVILRPEADSVVNQALSACPVSRSLRRQCFMLVKFFDPLFFGKGSWRLLLDSDVMFFRPPEKIREIYTHGQPCNWFNRDIGPDFYCINPKRAEAVLGRPMVDRLNAGLGLVHLDSINLAKCDEYLLACNFVGNSWNIEQTLHAMFSTVFGVQHLPPEYELTTDRKASEGAVSKHYIGRMTEMFFLDGYRRLTGGGSG